MSSSPIARTELLAASPVAQSTALPVPPAVMVLLSILSIQIGAATAKGLLATHAAFSIVLLRFGFAAIVLWVVAPPRMHRYSKSQWWHAAALGGAIAVLSLTFYEAVSRIPLGITMTIEFLGPLAVAVAASRKAKDLIWPGLALAGICLLTPIGNTGSLSLAGIAFAFFAAAAWGAYLVLAKRVTVMFSGATGLTLAMTFAAAISLPFGLFTGGKSLLHFALLGNGLLVAMLSTIIPFSLEFSALKRMSSRTFGIFMSTELSVAALVGLTVLHEHLPWRAWVALVFVSIASLGAMSQEANSSAAKGPGWRLMQL